MKKLIRIFIILSLILSKTYSFLILSTIHDEKLYVTYPPKTSYYLVTLNDKEIPRQNWPDDWFTMEIDTKLNLCGLNLSNITTSKNTVFNYQIRYYFKGKNEYIFDNKWRKIVYNIDYFTKETLTKN